jgi:hypothetical protein
MRTSTGSTSSPPRWAAGTRATRGGPTTSPHWGESFRFAASVIGLPMGGYPHSRPPQGLLPEAAKGQMRAAFEKAGLAKAEQPANV